MLNELDLASMFPSLSEAVNKSLESNNYCLTRIEDIISKLRGTLNSTTIDLTGSNTENENNPIKDKLQEDLDKDKARKEKRKELENESFDNATKETPEIQLEDPTLTEPQPDPVQATPPAPGEVILE